jgi:DNA-binding GntR family transcriptional regulator
LSHSGYYHNSVRTLQERRDFKTIPLEDPMTKLQTPSADTLGKRAYRELRDQILNGQLTPGQRLSLRGVANSLGMSMAPVGEALRELSRDGLVESEPGWGTRVRQMTTESLRGQHILRTAVECEAARQCARAASRDQIDELMQLATELDRRIDSGAEPGQIHGLDLQFHLRIAELTGAASLVEALRANQLVRMLARGSVLARNVACPTRQHLQLVDAIQSGDPDQAEAAMREHCVRSMELQVTRNDVGLTGSMNV